MRPTDRALIQASPINLIRTPQKAAHSAKWHARTKFRQALARRRRGGDGLRYLIPMHFIGMLAFSLRDRPRIQRTDHHHLAAHCDCHFSVRPRHCESAADQFPPPPERRAAARRRYLRHALRRHGSNSDHPDDRLRAGLARPLRRASPRFVRGPPGYFPAAPAHLHAHATRSGRRDVRNGARHQRHALHWDGSVALRPRIAGIGAGTIDQRWLALTIAIPAIAVLAITTILLVYDSHLDSLVPQT